ncbi:hypothetical protein AGABI1DRAFT_95529, partial [Agaricus bisporus var. burnettii JB137-S8]
TSMKHDILVMFFYISKTEFSAVNSAFKCSQNKFKLRYISNGCFPSTIEDLLVHSRIIEDNSEPWAAQYRAKVGPENPPTVQESTTLPIPSDPLVSQSSTVNSHADNDVETQGNVPHRSTGGLRPVILDDTENESNDEQTPVPHNGSRSSVASKNSVGSLKEDAIEVEDSDTEPEVLGQL